MSVNEREPGAPMEMEGVELVKVDEYEYVGSTIQGNGQCTRELKRVQAGWSRWRRVSGLICDRRIAAARW